MTIYRFGKVMEEPDIYVFDVDGTITNVSDRVKLLQQTNVQKQHWDEFFRRCVEDTPNTNIIKLMCSLYNGGAKIYIFTGRQEAEREVTVEQINRFCLATCATNFYPEKMFMRQTGDDSEDTDIKTRNYQQLSDDEKDRIICVFEDRDSVVAMWRELDITCCQVRPGNY